MPTYTINGKRIKTDRELSEAEIDEIARDLAPVSGQAAIPTEGQPTAPAAVPTLSASERMFQNALAGAAAVPPMAAAARALQALTTSTSCSLCFKPSKSRCSDIWQTTCY